MTALYTYRATVVRWIDGDTVRLNLDLGFDATLSRNMRVLGVDTPERGQPGYIEARECAAAVCPAGTALVVTTEKPLADDKYGRYLIPLPQVVDALRAAGLLKIGSKYNAPAQETSPA